MSAISPAQKLFAAFFAIYFALSIDRSFRQYRPYDTYAAWIFLIISQNKG